MMSAQAEIDELKVKVRALLHTVLERAFGAVDEKIDKLIEGLEEVAQSGGPTVGAMLGAADAALNQRSPLWGALSRSIASLSPGTKIALLIGLLLAIVLLPVTVLLLLVAILALAVALLVSAARR